METECPNTNARGNHGACPRSIPKYSHPDSILAMGRRLRADENRPAYLSPMTDDPTSDPDSVREGGSDYVTEREEIRAERERLALQQQELLRQQHLFVKDVLSWVTEGKLRLCETDDEIPGDISTRWEWETVMHNTAQLFDVRQNTREAARQCGLSDEQTVNLVAAVNEITTNAQKHGASEHGAVVRILVAVDASEIQVVIVDRGKGIVWEEIPRATLLRGYSTAGTLGQGYHITLQCTDCVFLHTSPAGTTVILRQYRDEPTVAW